MTCIFLEIPDHEPVCFHRGVRRCSERLPEECTGKEQCEHYSRSVSARIRDDPEWRDHFVWQMRNLTEYCLKQTHSASEFKELLLKEVASDCDDVQIKDISITSDNTLFKVVFVIDSQEFDYKYEFSFVITKKIVTTVNYEFKIFTPNGSESNETYA